MTPYNIMKEMEQNLSKSIDEKRIELRQFVQNEEMDEWMKKWTNGANDRKIGPNPSSINKGNMDAWKKFISRTITVAEQRKEDLSLEPYDYFKKNIRKYLFPDETSKNVDNKARRFDTQPFRSWRTPKQINPESKDKPITDEFKKRVLIMMKKSNQTHTNLDNLSNKERTRLMKEGRCFKCKKQGHRVRDCPLEDEQKESDNKSTLIQTQMMLSKLDKTEKEKLRKNLKKEGLIVSKKTVEINPPQNEIKKATIKDVVGRMKMLMKDEKAKFAEWMKKEEEPNSLEKETAPIPISPSLDVDSVIANIDSHSMNVPMTISIDEQKSVETDSLLDSSAGGLFIDQSYARWLHLDIQMLDTPVKARNVDGTENKRGTIKSYVDLQIKIGDKDFTERFFLTGLGNQTVILGLPWLKKHNPLIDWQTGYIAWRDEEKETRTDPKSSMEEEEDQEQWKTRTLNPINEEDDNEIVVSYLEEIKDDELWINAKMNIAVELAIKENKKGGKKEISMEELVPEDLHDFLDVFNEKQADRFPDSRPWDHKIEMKEGFEPKSFKVYNLTPIEQTELDKFLKENLDKGYIRPSQSPMASPFFFVTKKDGRLRPCQDYRYLNDWTIKNVYPLPLISEIMDKLKGAKYFTKFDVKKAYNNIRIRSGDEWKGAFKTNRGLYEPTVMFFGMCNSPATFQSMMDSIFPEEIEGNLIIIYMDDILIFAPNLEELVKSERMVLQKLRDNDLYLKPKKCEFREPKVEYLGMVIKAGQISMDPVKLGGIRNCPIPTTVKEVRSFLGFGNFYRQFIQGFSELAQPLNNPLKKDTKFEWTSYQQHAFETLKRRFTEEPVLMML